MKKIFIVFIFSLCCISLSAQNNKFAKIEFETTIIDYGTIEKGSNGLRVFKFKNTGNAPLVVSSVKSSCGCTVPKKPEAPVMPGESGEIEVKYDTNRVNPIRKTITVTSNADTPTVALKIKGNVIDSSKKNAMKKTKSIVEK
tara:strand:- start:233 stop:658 length:426 start_codon:yes stop_codon:yes gene_type:complete